MRQFHKKWCYGRRLQSPGAVAIRRAPLARGGAILALAAALLAVLAFAAPARAQDDELPVQLVVTVLPSNSVAPRPTGDIIVSIGGRTLLRAPLVRGLEPLTSITPLLNASLAAFGQHVRIGYSGDNNYEASDGLVITVPTRKSVVSIAPRPRDSAAPVISIDAPGDGARYARGASLVARYSCADPGERSPVRRCEGDVDSGAAIDTSTAGRFTFRVRSADALGNAGSKTVTFTVGEAAPGSGERPTPAPAGIAEPDAAAPLPAQPAAAAPPVVAVSPELEPGAQPEPDPGPADAAPAANRSSPRSSPVEGSGEPASTQSGSSAAASPISEAFAPYDPRSEPEKTFGILVAGLALLSLATGAGGLARGGGVARPAGAAKAERPRFSGLSSYQGVEVRALAAGFGATAIGDRSRTWTWPATTRIDAASAALPALIGRTSPLLGRVLADSTYLRAILGSASILAPLAGLALGVAAIENTGGEALPPSLFLTAAIVVLGALDAAAGLAAVTTFLLGTLLLGGLSTGDDVRLMLGLGALWAVVPVLAGATRPLRRAPTRGLSGLWERGADFVVVALIGAWAVQRIVLALPGLAGIELPIAVHADTIALIVLATLVVRVGLETLAAHLYPRRLDSTSTALPVPGKLTLIGGAIGRTAIYAFLAYVLIGDVWQLWVASGLFLLTQLIWVYPERFPSSQRLYRALPKGLTLLTVFLFAYTLAWLLMQRVLDTEADSFFPNVLVGFGLLGLLLPLPLLFGRSGDARAIGWGKRLLGLAVLVIAVLQVRGYLIV